jgi:hypothetical protein
LDAQTTRPHVDPSLIDIFQAIALGAFLPDAIPALRQWPVLWPNRVLLLTVYDYKIDPIVLIIDCHSQLLALNSNTDHIGAAA